MYVLSVKAGHILLPIGPGTLLASTSFEFEWATRSFSYLQSKKSVPFLTSSILFYIRLHIFLRLIVFLGKKQMLEIDPGQAPFAFQGLQGFTYYFHNHANNLIFTQRWDRIAAENENADRLFHSVINASFLPIIVDQGALKVFSVKFMWN